MNDNIKFHNWSIMAKSPLQIEGRPLPLLTELLYSICGNDEEKFNRVIEMLQEAFEAGARTTKGKTND